MVALVEQEDEGEEEAEATPSRMTKIQSASQQEVTEEMVEQVQEEPLVREE